MCVLYLAMYVATCIDWTCMADHDNHDRSSCTLLHDLGYAFNIYYRLCYFINLSLLCSIINDLWSSIICECWLQECRGGMWVWVWTRPLTVMCNCFGGWHAGIGLNHTEAAAVNTAIDWGGRCIWNRNNIWLKVWPVELHVDHPQLLELCAKRTTIWDNCQYYVAINRGSPV